MKQASISEELLNRARKIRLVILDFDGVMTDGSLFYALSGEEMRRFDIKDGLGVQLLTEQGIQFAIVTASSSSIIEKRAQKLKIAHVVQNVHLTGKWAVVEELLQKLKLRTDQAAYIGDDIPDIECLKQVGLACCPNDAVKEVKAVCHFVSEKLGGRGAIRECCDLIRFAQST